MRWRGRTSSRDHPNQPKLSQFKSFLNMGRLHNGKFLEPSRIAIREMSRRANRQLHIKSVKSIQSTLLGWRTKLSFQVPTQNPPGLITTITPASQQLSQITVRGVHESNNLGTVSRTQQSWTSWRSCQAFPTSHYAATLQRNAGTTPGKGSQKTQIPILEIDNQTRTNKNLAEKTSFIIIQTKLSDNSCIHYSKPFLQCHSNILN